jgi:putative ABC transport system ATP-binding protein
MTTTSRRGTLTRSVHGGPSSAADPAIIADGLTKVFRSPAEDVFAVNDVSFTIEAGSLCCVHGASGSGKSTLLALLAGLEVPDEGAAWVAGHQVTALPDRERSRLRLHTIGVVFQEDNLIAEFNAWENVALPLEARGVEFRAAREEALALLSRVGLEGLGDRRPDELSGGQRQRVGIARCLAGDRQILLADEPTGSLDSSTSIAIFELIAELCVSVGVTALVASHDPTCREFANRSFEMIDGSLSEER